MICGCGGKETPETPKTGSAEKILMEFDGKEVSFQPSYARFATFKKGLILKDSSIQNKDERVESVVHRIYLANYDLQLTDSSKQDYRRIVSDGQNRVEVQIEAEKDAPETAPMKVGNYSFKSEPFDRISSIIFSRFKDGKDLSHIVGGKAATGTIKISSVSDDEITGEIDVSDGDKSVKGKFKARRLGK